MATFTKRGPYQWEARIRRRGYPTVSRTFVSRADAQAWANEIESEYARGLYRPRGEAEKTTLHRALERYKQEITPSKKHPETEIKRIKAMQRRNVSAYYLSRIGGKEVAQLIADRESDGVGANTIRLDLALLSHLFNIARTDWGMESLSNPVKFVRRPRLPRGRDRRLMHGEEKKLFAECRKGPKWLSPIVHLALETGMRRSELSGLTWGAIDFSVPSATLPDTKNGETRIVPLSSTAVKVLTARPRKLDGGKIFDVAPDHVTHEFVAACKRANIAELTFHDLRHEATSRLFERGLNPMEVAAITGHKTLQMLKRYTHLRAVDLAKKLG